MMQAMRDRVKVIYWIVIISFVGLMFLVWGVGDWNNNGGQATSPGVVASVDGQPISDYAWRERANAILAQLRARQGNEGELSETDVLRAREQAFDELVDETLRRQAADDLGIKVTDDELVDMLRNDPPAYLLQQFADAQGNVDYDAYYSAMNNPQLAGQWGRVIDLLRSDVPLQKFDQRVAARAVVGDAELRAAFAEQTVSQVVEWIGVPFSDIEIEDESVSESEARAYYDSHLEEYKQPPRAVARVLQLEKTASEGDAQEVLSILAEIRTDIVEGRSTFEDAARTYSEDTSAGVGGDLGFFDRDRMVEPFTEAAFALAVGDISEPVKTQFGYHVIECTDERLDDAGQRTEMRARHILLKLHASQSTLDELRERGYSIYEQAESTGLEAAASAAGMELVTTAAFQEGFNVPGVPNSLPGSRFAFTNDVGTLSPLLENDEAIYFLEVAEKLPAGHRPLGEVRSLVDSAVQRERRTEVASTHLANALRGSGSEADLASIAESAGLRHAVTDTFTLRENVADIGFATAFSRVALSLDEGGFCPEVRTNRGVYALRVLYKSEFDEATFSASRAQIAQSVLFSRQRQILIQWLQQRRAAAKIVDNRADFS